MSSKDPNPIAAHGPPSEPYSALVAMVRLLARQAAQACCCEDPATDGRDRPRLEPTPPKSPDLE